MARPTSSCPRSSCAALYPGGPAIGIFTARYGPDNRFLGRFVLRVANSAAIPRMLDEGRAPARRALRRGARPGLLRPDPTPGHHRAAAAAAARGGDARIRCSRRGLPQVPAGAATTASASRCATPDAGAVQQAEVSVSRVDGVTSAITTSLALGGTSIMRVSFAGDAAALQAALQAQGWRVEVVSGNTLRISR